MMEVQVDQVKQIQYENVKQLHVENVEHVKQVQIAGMTEPRDSLQIGKEMTWGQQKPQQGVHKEVHISTPTTEGINWGAFSYWRYPALPARDGAPPHKTGAGDIPEVFCLMQSQPTLPSLAGDEARTDSTDPQRSPWSSDHD